MGKDELMTVIDASQYLGIHQQTVRDAIKRGKIDAVKVLGRTGVYRSQLDAYKARTQPNGVKAERGGRPKLQPSAPPPQAASGEEEGR